MNKSTALLTLTVLLLGCPPNQNTAPTAPAPVPAPPPPPATPEPKPWTPGNPAALLDPSLANETAPETFRASIETSKGNVVIEVTRAWAPKGADRFYNLVKIGYLNDARFFRVLKGFMSQFGINGDPKVNAVWQGARITDDPVTQSNTVGMVTFATAGPNTRTTQLFINTSNNANLDRMGFAPFGKVISGMQAVNTLYGGYGEGAPRGRGPDQGRAQGEGNAYLNASFPKLDHIKKATIVR